MIIKLSNGNVLENVSLNGNNFIPTSLDKSIFDNGLDEVIILDGELETVLTNQKIYFGFIGDIETFILHDKTKEDIMLEQLDSQELYIVENDFRLSLLEMGVNENDL